MNQSVFAHMKVAEQAASPTVPTGLGYFYGKTDGIPYYKNDAGEEYALNGEGSGGNGILEIHIPPNAMIQPVVASDLEPYFLLDGSRPITGLATFLSTVRSIRYDASASSGVNLQYYRAKGTIDSPTTTASGDRLVVLDARGHDGTGFVNAADFEARVDGTVSTGVVPGRWGFFVRDATGTRKEVLRVNSQCRAGINTTAPAAAVHAVTVDAALPAMRAQAAASQTANIAEWVDSSSTVKMAVSAAGRLMLFDVVTSDPSVAGEVWSDGGVLTLSAGA